VVELINRKSKQTCQHTYILHSMSSCSQFRPTYYIRDRFSPLTFNVHQLRYVTSAIVHFYTSRIKIQCKQIIVLKGQDD